MRCFIALPLPEAARERLVAATTRLRFLRPDLKWVGVQGYHLTLAFLGEIDGAALDCAARAMGAAGAMLPIAFRFGGLGGFPPRRSSGRPSWRVFVAHIEDLRPGSEEGLSPLCRLVNAALAAETAKSDLPPLNPEGTEGGRAFRAHVTLARAGEGRVRALFDPAEVEAAARLLEGEWTMDRCVLYKSLLRPSGAVYSEIESVPLAGTDARSVLKARGAISDVA